MLENNDRFPLQEIIMEDLFTSNKLVLILLLAITISALGTVWITHQTRGVQHPNKKLLFLSSMEGDEYGQV